MERILFGLTDRRIHPKEGKNDPPKLDFERSAQGQFLQRAIQECMEYALAPMAPKGALAEWVSESGYIRNLNHASWLNIPPYLQHLLPTMSPPRDLDELWRWTEPRHDVENELKQHEQEVQRREKDG